MMFYCNPLLYLWKIHGLYHWRLVCACVVLKLRIRYAVHKLFVFTKGKITTWRKKLAEDGTFRNTPNQAWERPGQNAVSPPVHKITTDEQNGHPPHPISTKSVNTFLWSLCQASNGVIFHNYRCIKMLTFKCCPL